MALDPILLAPLRAAHRLASDVAQHLGAGETQPREGPRPGPAAAAPAPSARSESSSIGSRRRRELLRDLRRGGARTRVRAAQQIEIEGLREAVAELALTARDRRGQVRRAALQALLTLEPGAFAETAMELLQVVPQAELLADLDAVAESLIRSHSSRRQPIARSDG